MTPILALEAVIAAGEILAVPLIYFLTPRKEPPVAVIPQIEDLLNQIPAAVKQAIDTAVANAPLPAGAASAQDVADTTAAVQTVLQNIPSTQA